MDSFHFTNVQSLAFVFCIPEQLHNSNIDLNQSPLSLTLTAKSIKMRVYLICPGMQCNYKQFVFSVVKYGLEKK